MASIPDHPSGKTMKAVCFSDFGPGAESLSVQTNIPKPSITKPNQVLIEVHACALNPIDKIRLSGGLKAVFPEPYETTVLGYDVAGIIREVGDEVKTKNSDGDDALFHIGDECFARIGATAAYGALAQYVVCDVKEVGKKPSNISFVEAAAVPLAGLTALQALRRGGVKEGSRVFIPGGAGGVGTLAIQIAKKVLKAGYVCTTASPGKGTDICKRVGADRVIDYRSEDFEKVLNGEDFDMAFDTMNQGAKMGSLLKKGGKIISISGNPSIEAIASALTTEPGLAIRFFMFLTRNRAAEKAALAKDGEWHYIFMNPSGENLNEIAPFLQNGDIEVILDDEGKAESLDDFKVAVDKLWSGRSKGKCVIKVV